MANTTSLADALTGLTASDQQLSIQNYVIDHVGSAATTTDGVAGIFLQIGADVVQSAYLDSLTSPVAGQKVRVLIVNNSPTILGRVVGLPNI
jgi:hypothetical protein